MGEFKDRILELRLEKHFNQEQLAKALNVSKSTIGMWETGKRLPGPDKYEEIADYFNIDMDYIYGRTDIRKKIHYDSKGNEYILNSPTVLDNDTTILLNHYNKLNAIGKTEATKRVEELTYLPHYTESSDDISSFKISKTTSKKEEFKNAILNAAHEDSPTPEQESSVDHMMKDDNEWE